MKIAPFEVRFSLNHFQCIRPMEAIAYKTFDIDRNTFDNSSKFDIFFQFRGKIHGANVVNPPNIDIFSHFWNTTATLLFGMGGAYSKIFEIRDLLWTILGCLKEYLN